MAKRKINSYSIKNLHLFHPTVTDGIEMVNSIPYIDFHFNRESELDYTSRLYEFNREEMAIKCKNFMTLLTGSMVVSEQALSPKGKLHIVGDIYCTGKIITESGFQDNSTQDKKEEE